MAKRKHPIGLDIRGFDGQYLPNDPPVEIEPDDDYETPGLGHRRATHDPRRPGPYKEFLAEWPYPDDD